MSSVVFAQTAPRQENPISSKQTNVDGVDDTLEIYSKPVAKLSRVIVRRFVFQYLANATA